MNESQCNPDKTDAPNASATEEIDGSDIKENYVLKGQYIFGVYCQYSKRVLTSTLVLRCPSKTNIPSSCANQSRFELCQSFDGLYVSLTLTV